MKRPSIETKDVSLFIKNAVDHLKKTDEACCFNYRLPGGEYVIAVGWLDGYDPNDGGYIHSKSQPSYCINAGIKVRNDGDCSDYMFLDMPWFDDDNVYDTEYTVNENENYKKVAEFMIRDYKYIQKLRDEGKLYNSTLEYWDEENKCWYAKER